MKKLIVILGLLIGLNSQAQRLGQPIGAANSIVYGRGGIMADQGLINSRLDTLNHPMKDSSGTLTYWNNKLWLRVKPRWIALDTTNSTSLQRAISNSNLLTQDNIINTAGYNFTIQDGSGLYGSRVILNSPVASFFIGTQSTSGGAESVNLYGSSTYGYMNIISPYINIGSTQSISTISPTAISNSTGVHLGSSINKFRRFYTQRGFIDSIDANLAVITLPGVSGNFLTLNDFGGVNKLNIGYTSVFSNITTPNVPLQITAGSSNVQIGGSNVGNTIIVNTGYINALGAASSTATQQNSNALSWEVAGWNGSSNSRRYSGIRNTASLTQNLVNYLDFLIGGGSANLSNATLLLRLSSTGNVGINTSSPNSSALLDLSSTDKGLLLPRMTKVQRDLIPSPVAGLEVYQTDNIPGIRVYNGTNWVRFTETND